MKLEVCCGSFADACAAERGGASRIELNSALSLGGLTPDIGSVLLRKEHLHIPVIAMLRPRAGGFCYTQDEFLVMRKSAEQLLLAGVDGLAFGILTETREVDAYRTKELTELVKSHGKEVVFHRAIDCVPSFACAIETLVSLGVTRVLTSGGAQTALQGDTQIRELQQIYGTSIEILAGSGVRSENVAELLKQTGVYQVHSSCKTFMKDYTAKGNGVSFAYEGCPDWYCYEAVSEDEVRKLWNSICRYYNENVQ